MTTKITKEFLRETIKKTIQEIGPIGAPEAKTDEETLRAAKATLNMVGRNSAITPDVIKANMTAAANVGTEEGLKIAKALAQYIMKKVRDTDARIAAGDVMKQSAPEAPAGSKASRAIADLYSDRVKQAKALTGKLFEDEEEASEELEENEELEEGGKYDDEDGKDEKCDYVPCKESKIQTPEQENTLYEQRFTPKNNRLFEKLLKEWTK